MDKPFALIIDDDRDTVALFRHVLDVAGYHTEIILHGKVAVERLAVARPDIVLLDLNLPGVSGTDILHLIRSHEHLKGTRVVVITGYSHIALNLEEEAELVLIKPVNIEQLSTLVQRLQPTREKVSEPPVDEVTGLYNLSFFRSRLEYSLARLKQLDLNHFTLLLMDLARFEAIESQMNEKEIRSLLTEVADLLKRILRPTDTIAHFEKSRFALLVEDVSHWDIPIMLANRIIEQMGRYLKEKGIDSHINIGIILCHVGYGNVDCILQDAYASLSLAKAEGRECYKFYAQDNLNNAYDLDMVADMLSLVGGEQVKRRVSSSRGIRVRPIGETRQSLQPAVVVK
jgi:diguanylate cyclase (GGDEF)-like protein